MIKTDIINLGYYDTAEEMVQHNNTFFLVYYTKGLKHIKAWYPDGRIIYQFDRDPGPFMSLIAPGGTTEFSFSKERKNWVMIFDTDHVRYNVNSRKLEINQDEAWLPIPSFVTISRDQSAYWNIEFRRLFSRYSTATPKSLLALEFGLLNVLSQFLTVVEANNEQSQAEKIKSRIDSDIEFKLNLSEISEQCGYSRDHARRLFKQVYHLNPREYRDQRRINQLMTLIADSRLSITQLADKTGFRYTSHMMKFLKRTTGKSPSELIKLYRKT